MPTYPVDGSKPWSANLKTYVDNPVSLTTNLAFGPGDFNRAVGVSSTYNIIGIDTVNDALYCRDDNNGFLRLCTAVDSSSRPTTWSGNKGFPAGVSWFNVQKILTFGGSLYMLAQADATGIANIYRATPTSGSTALTWSASLKAGVTGTTARPNCFSTDGTYLYFAEYGDPTGGPSLYRSPDGTTWTNVKTWSTVRHAHCVVPDPFTPGTIWVGLGDGVANPVQFSSNSGTSWTATTIPVQLTDFGFTSADVYGIDDTSYVGTITISRDGTSWRGISDGFHANVSVPTKVYQKTWDPPSTVNGAIASTTVTAVGLIPGVPLNVTLNLTAIPAGVIFYAVSDYDLATVTMVNHSGGTVDLASATLNVAMDGLAFAPALFYGVVDPSTSIVYMISQQSTLNPLGALFALLRKSGQPNVLEVAAIGNWPPYIWHGRLFYGPLNRPLLTSI